MDFQTLARRDLQYLCKKNGIPANMTNVAMANALQALDAVEGMEEMQSKLGLQSVGSPELPRSHRISSSRRATPGIEPKMQASSLPWSRRVTAKALEIVEMSLDEKEEKRDVPEQTLDTPAAIRSTRKMTRGRAGAIASTPVSKRAVPLRSARQDDLDEKEETRDLPEQTLDTPATIRSTRKMTRGRAEAIASAPVSKRTVPLPPALQDDLDEKEETRDPPEQTLDTPAGTIRSTRKMTRGRAEAIASTPVSKPTVPLRLADQDDLDEKEETRAMPEQALDTPATMRSTRKMTMGGAEATASTPASKRTVPLRPACEDDSEAKYLGITYRRSSSVSLSKQAEEMTDVCSRRRSSRRAEEVVKMAALAQEDATEEEKVETVEIGDLVNVDGEKNYQVEVIGSPEESPVMGLVSSDADTALVLKDSNNQMLANETLLGDSSSSKNGRMISASPPEEAFSSVDGFCGAGEEEEEEEEKKLGQLLTEMTLADSEEGKNRLTQRDVLQAAEEAGGPVASATIDLSNGVTMTGGDVGCVFSVSPDKPPDLSQDASFQPTIAAISTEINDELSAANNLRVITAEATEEVTEEIPAGDSSGESHDWDAGNKIPSISSLDEKLSGESTTMSSSSISSIVQTESPGSAAVERENWLTSDHLKSLSLRQLKALLKQKMKEDKMENKEPLIKTAELQASMDKFREDNKKAKMENKEPLIKTAELQASSMDKFREDKMVKLERNRSPFMHLN